MITPDDVYAYLGIDYIDDMTNARVSSAISAADSYLKGAIGSDYPQNDARAKELALMVVADLYDNRGTTVKEGSTISRLVSDFVLQLQMEVRRQKENDV